MTRPPRPARVGHDRWLVSYADFVTLLLLFFVTLYGLSTLSADAAGPVPPALRMALDAIDPSSRLTSGRPQLVTPPDVVARGTSLDAVRRQLTAVFAEALRDGRLDVSLDLRGLVLSLPEDATFESASAEVTPRAQSLITQVASELARTSNALRIEGHTDDIPVRAGRYRSNWELSTARAGAVVAFLIDQAHLSPQRLSAAGYAEFHPRVPNDSADHRARNRRVDIVVIELPGI